MLRFFKPCGQNISRVSPLVSEFPKLSGAVSVCTTLRGFVQPVGGASVGEYCKVEVGEGGVFWEHRCVIHLLS